MVKCQQTAQMPQLKTWYIEKTEAD